ncbi:MULTISPECIES: peptidoglycan editing factor PgeF [unclassified Bacillus (in: firmicutes)]|uniref:peptidoglycan editing factor PgeF n=1 Tax=unclassified Bacillus (in: firmicutes) TaxID=185979 RepID=UPI0008F32625|nr:MULTISPECIES: peptidoglycan editing factor PgeF [unclassified Bacillus (in: firmicutes)]SFA75260.1 conserved hypothetical protein [Bacillus sp. UNCCL13]SFQ65393.1 conserved hypothetical protein [Bacillus sp. cl95]
MEPFVKQNEQYYSIKNWVEQYPGLVAGFTTKNGGSSKDSFQSQNFGFHVGDNLTDVCANRESLAKSIRVPLEKWVGAEQTHGIRIKKVTSEDCGKGSYAYDDSIKDTDGFYSTEKGILMTLCFADCVPLYFIAPEKKMIGIAHAGWKGTVHGIGAKMVSTWQQEGIDVERISVIIGPSICKKCYIVDDYVITFVQNTLEHVEKKPYNQIQEGQYTLDLQELNKQLLMKQGIKEDQILTTTYCSSCHQDEFFSHRRDNGKTGRMMSFIGWREDSDF